MIQIDPVKRYVYIKFKEEDCMNKVLQDSEGRLEYKHDNGEITQVIIEVAGLGIKRVRITRLPPEITESDIRAYMTQYGEVKSVRDELWNSAYRYKVYNGVRIADMKLKKHIPSHLNILGYDAMIAYGGQPQTCYRCNEVGHQRQECPRGKRVAATTHTQPNTTWADIISSRIQAHSPDIPTVQNPLSSGNKTKRQHTFTDETPDKEYMSGTHDLQNETDGKSMETTEIENDHKNQDISDNGDVEMNPSGYLEVGNSSKDDRSEKKRVDKEGYEKYIPANNKELGMNNNTAGTRAEEARKENNNLEEKRDYDNTLTAKVGAARTKKLKTEREDPDTSMKHRSRSRIKKGPQTSVAMIPNQ